MSGEEMLCILFFIALFCLAYQGVKALLTAWWNNASIDVLNADGSLNDRRDLHCPSGDHVWFVCSNNAGEVISCERVEPNKDGNAIVKYAEGIHIHKFVTSRKPPFAPRLFPPREIH